MASRYDANTKARAVRLVRAHAGPSSTETTERHLRAQTCAGIGKQDASIGWWGCEGKR